LLWRNRISWHIPLSLLGTFSVLALLNGSAPLSFSMAGILLGTIFMATDMPSSPTTPAGKAYYGMMIGAVMFLMIKGGVRYEYTSYSILLLNAFSRTISLRFRPRAWGEERDRDDRETDIREMVLLTGKILMGAFAVISLHRSGLIHYLVFIYIICTLLNFNFSVSRKLQNAI
ncbi:MAG: electron transporter, partial [Verrucomicrobiaceae bacterium]